MTARRIARSAGLKTGTGDPLKAWEALQNDPGGTTVKVTRHAECPVLVIVAGK